MRVNTLLWRDVAGSGFFGASARLFGGLWRALRNRREVHRLADLDDRALKDIGLLRSDVEGALLEPFHKDPSRVLSVRRVERRGRSRPEVTTPAALAEREMRFAPRHACCV